MPRPNRTAIRLAWMLEAFKLSWTTVLAAAATLISLVVARYEGALMTWVTIAGLFAVLTSAILLAAAIGLVWGLHDD